MPGVVEIPTLEELTADDVSSIDLAKLDVTPWDNC